MTDTYEPPIPDYRIDGFAPATEALKQDFFAVTLSDDMFVPLAEHHSDDGYDSYLLFHDQAATWGVSGTAEYVAFHLTRDMGKRAFTFDYERAPVVPLAQNWLVRRGCPPDATMLDRNHGPRPADALTSRLEDLLRTNPDGRYEVLDHYTDTPGSLDIATEVRTLVRDSHPDSAPSSAEAADAWAMDRSAPLPLPPGSESSAVHRAHAARARTRSALAGSASLAVPPAPVTAPRSAAHCAPCSGRGAR
ncbi:hypothetical protein ACF08B_28605 [Streptomyces sp. NPDC015139]|uniref:hypothetical protein n=1 Tax=Streptomyces sp. NPDC015139 TaxID=3364942 RepID=UPI0036FA49B6